MTPERSSAYGRVIRTLEEAGAVKLLDIERVRLRTAADTLLFAQVDDPATLDALADAEHLTRHLVETGRWSAERAAALADDIAACGPSMADDVPVLAA